MKNRSSKTAKRKIITIASVIAVLAFILYLAADRFLIEHVQVDLNKSAYSQVVSPSEMSSGENNAAAEAASGESKAGSSFTADSYQGNGKTINIKKVITGSGSAQVVYYVADVTLSDAADLKSAFADNKFGTNIVELPSVISQANQAIFAINGDYYGFRDDGIIIRNGVLYRDVPVREGLAIYQGGSMQAFDETKTSGKQLLEEGVIQTLSFGPALLKDGKIISGIENVEVDTNFGNHSIQGNQPRTGIGIIDNNHFVFIVVDGRSPGYSKGMTMTEFAETFQSIGCKTAYNIDGGGSSEMYFNGHVISNTLGRGVERGTSDILYITE